MSEHFKELVDRDVRKGVTEEEIDELKRDPRQWLDELNILLRDVEIQIAAQKARISAKRCEMSANPEGWNATGWYEYKASEDGWKVKALRFRASIEERIRFVKTYRSKLNANN